MSKQLVLMQGPFNTRSGYGDHARSLFYALNDSKKYDIVLADVRWGETPRNFLQHNNPRHKQVLDCFLKGPIKQQPDIYFDVRIPNEFQQVGKINIGVTAGIETTAISQPWVDGCNKMDMIIVPSEHSKASIVNTIYDQVNNMPDGTTQKVGEKKVTKPVKVLFEGAEDDIFNVIKPTEIEKGFFDYINDMVEEKFAFLFVGQWVKGGFGEDRKDIYRTIKVFSETFANKSKQPALILKTSGATFSLLDKVEILGKIKSVQRGFPEEWKLPPVYLLHGDLSEMEMSYLYNHPKIKSLVSFTHGEGFGRPLLEATMVDLPVICSNWSGPVDFLSKDRSILVSGKLDKIPNSAVWDEILIRESSWFTVDEHEAYTALKYAYENINELKDKAKTLGKENRSKYKQSDMMVLFNEIVSSVAKDVPKPVSLNLPKLKKI